MLSSQKQLGISLQAARTVLEETPLLVSSPDPHAYTFRTISDSAVTCIAVSRASCSRVGGVQVLKSHDFSKAAPRWCSHRSQYMPSQHNQESVRGFGAETSIRHCMLQTPPI